MDDHMFDVLAINETILNSDFLKYNFYARIHLGIPKIETD